ncbi:Putative epoxidase LasC [Streptomyces sp. enrichment culture]|uniref:FAD-dependent oxidoreductase n=1 Tax=Streptomyces sp. enrichment culture TaxID=1795815 RepID=UPI003F5464BE
MSGPPALVLGGSLAGLLTATVLRRHHTTVTVLDQDRLPTGAVHRAGTPQAHHGHLLLPAGSRYIEALLPGTLGRLLAVGAHRIDMSADVVSLGDLGWQPRTRTGHLALLCSRPLLEWTLRERVRETDGITLVTGAQVRELTGSRHRVTGALARHRDGTTRWYEAALTVDATGRASRTPALLTALGLPPVRERTIDAGVAYASVPVLAPPAARDGFPLIGIQPGPSRHRPARAGVVFPIEDGRWMISLSGTRGAEPPLDHHGFLAFARSLDHPVIADLLTSVTPVAPIRGYRHTGNRRRYYERMRRWPEGFLVVGDALLTTNPTFGYGMTATAAGVTALADTPHASSRDTQRAIARAVSGAWHLASGTDLLHPGATGPGSRRAARVHRSLVLRLERAAHHDPRLRRTLVRVGTLSDPPSTLLTPAVARALLLPRARGRGPATPGSPAPGGSAD